MTPARQSRLLLTLMGGALVLVGTGVAIALFIPYQRSMESRQWIATPAVITRSEVIVPQAGGFDLAWRVALAFEYTHGGKRLTSTRWRRVTFYEAADADISRKTPDREIAGSLAARYPVGASTICYVNPAQPTEAVLEHHTKAAIYTLWWPLLFAVGGGGMIWAAWRTKSPKIIRNY
jgi:hypothetical protein